MQENGRIEIMPEELASQIAAGEVVERPASVIKELVENSLDAGSSSIEIDVSLARRRFRIKDDGCGIPADSIEKALARHGTSKVHNLDDIFGIKTFGFRGEALPSVGSVSRLTLSSCADGAKTGKTITVEGGKTVSATDAPPVAGTEVLVENLFFNTPARRKFARSDTTEMTHITSSVIQAALANPQVRFSFVRDKKRVFELPPAGSLRERIRQIFGGEYAERLVETDYSDGLIKISGMVGKPDFNRATSMDQYFFVNSRPVKDALLRTSVARAYSDLLPRGRKPVIFFKVDIPFDQVDVNVHPTKAEIRFSEPGRVSSAIVAAIRKSLGKSAVPVFSQERTAWNSGGGFEPRPQGAVAIHPETGRDAGFERSFELWSLPLRETPEQSSTAPAPVPTHGRLSEKAVPIGQVFETFILMEEGEKLVFMDQHTVHERILFERLMKKFLDSAVERQKLLVTATFQTSPTNASLIRSHQKTFGDLGWGLEEFGEDSFIVREVPALLVGKDYPTIILELSETIAGNREADFKQMMSGLIASMACRAAVKAGDRLTLQEISAMVEELGRTELPFTCPHGRPVALEIDKQSLRAGFGR